MVKTKLYHKFVETLPDVSGKVFVITGTTSGTGNVAARTVAKLGGEAVLLNRRSDRSTNSLAAMKEDYPDATLVPIECDLQSFESVKNAIAEIKSKYSETGIYCMACNAGIMATPDKATVDGYDTQMQTNHLSHFLLIEELMPLLETGAAAHGEARIVTHSSGARDMCQTPNKGLDAKFLGKNGGKLGGDELKLFKGPVFERYFQSKLANSVHMHGLHERLKDGKIKAISAHPGGSDTNLGDHLKFGYFTDMFMKTVFSFMAQTSEDGALGLLRGMMDPEAESGVLYGPKKSGISGPAVPNPPKEYETDPKAIEMLFKASEEAVASFKN